MDEVERRSEMDAALQAIAVRLADLHQAIETLQQGRLRADGVALLAMYEQNERRLLGERGKLERERAHLMVEEYEGHEHVL